MDIILEPMEHALLAVVLEALLDGTKPKSKDFWSVMWHNIAVTNAQQIQMLSFHKSLNNQTDRFESILRRGRLSESEPNTRRLNEQGTNDWGKGCCTSFHSSCCAVMLS